MHSLNSSQEDINIGVNTSFIFFNTIIPRYFYPFIALRFCIDMYQGYNNIVKMYHNILQYTDNLKVLFITDNSEDIIGRWEAQMLHFYTSLMIDNQ